MNPITELVPGSQCKLDADFSGLCEAFRIGRGFISAETLRIYAAHHSTEQLQQLGWIKPASCGRWLNGFAPAGELAAIFEEHDLSASPRLCGEKGVPS